MGQPEAGPSRIPIAGSRTNTVRVVSQPNPPPMPGAMFTTPGRPNPDLARGETPDKATQHLTSPAPDPAPTPATRPLTLAQTHPLDTSTTAQPSAQALQQFPGSGSEDDNPMAPTPTTRQRSSPAKRKSLPDPDDWRLQASASDLRMSRMESTLEKLANVTFGLAQETARIKAEPVTQTVYAPRPPTPAEVKINVSLPKHLDGSKPDKVFEWINGMEFFFKANGNISDERKIAAACTRLDGMALQNIVNLRDMDVVPDCVTDDWEGFKAYIKSEFGPVDIVGSKEDELDRLRMNHTDTILAYTTEFRTIASFINWNDDTLRHRYYIGLPNRLKDEVARQGYKTGTLNQVIKCATTADSRYHARAAEKSTQPTTRPTQSSSTSYYKSSTASSNTTTTTTATDTRPNAHLLDSSGKLKAEEKQRRKAEGLCLYCGAKDHQAADCGRGKATNRAKSTPPPPASERPRAKARAAEAIVEVESDDEDSKN